MGVHESATIRTVRFHDYGEPADVPRMDRVGVPDPGPDRIRVIVHACGLNPADWALCRGLFPGVLPRGIGLELSGTVDTVGPGVADVAAGDLVQGTADYGGSTSAGAADRAIMDRWARVPAGLDLVQAAALPMAVETAYWHLEYLGVSAGRRSWLTAPARPSGSPRPRSAYSGEPAWSPPPVIPTLDGCARWERR
jgi:NADPH:quinone reductase-like Zn-dependent oxidoreductase